MNSGQRTARRLVASSTRTTPESVCNSCLARISQHRSASTAAAVAPEVSTSSQVSQNASATPAIRPAYQLRTGVVLSRPPVLTRSLHPFEKAFFLYQKRLNERLALPFTRYFYYKKGTPGEREWKRKIALRKTPARDVGVYNAYSESGWNDEVLVNDTTSEPESQVEALIRDAEGTDGEAGAKRETSQDIVVQRPLPRVTEQDQKGDQTSLNRLLDRTLYLLVKNKNGIWRFPEDEIKGPEGLDQAAERIIVQAGGINMNTWVVGNAPIGHYSGNFKKTITNTEKKVEEIGERTFFMKARIMAGQANIKANTYGDKEFKWLSSEEIQQTVTPKYWSAIANMLTGR
ncbi:50S ribosomal subunit L30, partial [Aureobasidium melanogenum]